MSVIRVDKYTLIKLEENDYGVRLMEGWENRDGEFKPNFCKRSFTKDGEEKNVPVSVKLGDREKAREVLTELLQGLGGKGRQEAEDFGESIPF